MSFPFAGTDAASAMAIVWLVVVLVSGAALVGVTLVLRDLARAEAHAEELEAEIERLHDRIFVLADSEERLRDLAEAHGDYVVRRDDRGRIVFANEGYARLAGVARDTLRGCDVQLTVKERRNARTSESGARLVDEAVEAGGAVRWISWLEAAIPTPSGIDIQRVGRDVTERFSSERALEAERAKAEAASEAKSRFLATVSHEIRTPLNGVLGMAGLLADTPLTPEQATYVHAVRTSGEALLTLIDGILDFSKIEAGKLELAAVPFDPRELVEGVVELLAPRAQGKGIEIAASVAAEVPAQVSGDADRLRQVLMNLAGNAVKFTETGGVGVSVAACGGGGLRFAVADTGPGIPESRRAVIFQEFEQADATPSRRHEGTGLGLTISRRIVELMGGAIVVDSEAGRGSTFSFSLPLPACDPASSQPPVPDLEGLRALIVAQSPFEAPFIARRLAEAHASVEHVRTAAEAEAALARHPAGLVLADCALGEDAVRRIAAAARLSGTGRTLVLLSPFERRGFGSPSKAGFDGYLVKPVRPASLFARVRAAGSTAPKRVDPEKDRGHGPEAPRLHVLLAEDNEINALVALKTLERMGATADWARNGAHAVKLARAAILGGRQAYDAVLMDVRMPELDGLAATRRIRALEAAGPGPQRLRIIALTANAFPEDRAAAQEAGADTFLSKPFDPEALRSLLLEPQPAVRAASLG